MNETTKPMSRETAGQIILQYLQKHKQIFYRNKKIRGHLGLTQGNVLHGSRWLHEQGYIRKWNGKQGPWEYIGEEAKKWERKL